MKNFIKIFLFLWMANEASAQTKFQNNLVFKNNNYSSYTIKIDSTTLKNFKLISGNNLNHKDFIEQYIANHDSTFFAINACINNNNGEALGLFISNHQSVNPINFKDGTGNFFLKPNGVLFLTDKDANVVDSKNFINNKDIINGIQSGPMLVIDDSIHPAFKSTSANKNIRCGAGVYFENNSKYIVFVISKNLVNFYEFASVFKEHFHCKNAICLESSNSEMYTSETEVQKLSQEKHIGNYLIYDPLASKRKKSCSVLMNKSKSGIYEIPVELNKVLKISFIFDSGASDISISPDVAFTLIRTGTITKEDYIGTQQYQFADGSTATSDVFNLREIKIGEYVIKNVRASISNSLNAPMLLGQSVMQRIGKLSIDNTKHTLTIENN